MVSVISSAWEEENVEGDGDVVTSGPSLLGTVPFRSHTPLYSRRLNTVYIGNF